MAEGARTGQQVDQLNDGSKYADIFTAVWLYVYVTNTIQVSLMY